jgi:hypothetical protein
MVPANIRLFSTARPSPVRRRGAILVLVVVLHALLMLMLLRLAPPVPPFPSRRLGPITIQLLPDGAAATKRSRVASKERASGAVLSRVPALPPPPAVAVPPPSDIWSQVIPLRNDEFAAADIARMPSHPMERAGEGSSGGDDAGSGSAGDGGEGPNGERLYDADWYRKPSNAELAAYLPPGAPRTGWGMIACKTVRDYRVEDCREIGQSPAGSGLARAVRQAAWQFRVLPPRIGGRPIIGAWVRIRIDYSESAARL